MDSKTQAPTSPLVDLIVRRPQTWGAILLAFGAVLLVGAALFGFNSRPDSAALAAEEAKTKAEKSADPLDPEGKLKPKDDKGESLLAGLNAIPAGGMVWCLASALLMGIGGGLALSRGGDRPTPVLARQWVAVFGGTFGLLAAVYGLFLMSQHIASISKAVEEKDIAQAGSLLQGFAVLFLGLVISFLSLQPARQDERNHPSLRRLIHGFNGVLNGILLAMILVGINVATSIWLPEKLDTTETSFYTLSEPSKTLLGGLSKPMRAYLIAVDDSASGIDADIRTMLSRCADQTGQFRVKVLSAGLEAKAIGELVKRLNAVELMKNRPGIILTYGEDEKQVAFVPTQQMIESNPETGALVFQGEAKLMTEIGFMANSESKSPVVCFIQGDKELDMGGPGAAPGRDGRTAQALKRMLEDSRYEVRTLSFGVGAPEGSLEGVDVAVLLAPHASLSPETLKALDAYMFPVGGRKPGRLMMFLPAWKEAATSAVGSTGADEFLARFGLKVNNSLTVLQPDLRNFPDPLLIPLEGMLVANDPLLPVMFDKTFMGYLTRTIQPINAPGGNLRPEPFLRTPPELIVWQEPNFGTNPEQTLKQMRTDRKLQAEKKVARGVPVGWRVSEQAPPAGPPGSPGGPGKSEPRLVVVGMGDCFSDEFLNNPASGIQPAEYTGLFKGLLDWVRNKPEMIGIAPKEYKVFSLNRNSSYTRVVWIPLALICLSSVVMGIGVWVLRRK